ncbi:MAG: lamin tail domain-containing protein [Minisyncoccia bacterium]
MKKYHTFLFLIFILIIPLFIKGVISKNIIFNEILPNPKINENNNEWIEIKNLSNEIVDLSGWKIRDIKGKTSVYYIPKNTKILPNDFLVFSITTTKIFLNNKADGLILEDNFNNIIDTVSYENSLEDRSYCRIDGNWQWCKILTPGKENIKDSEKIEKNNNELFKKDNQNNKFIKIEDKKIIFFIAIFLAFSFSFLVFYFLKFN